MPASTDQAPSLAADEFNWESHDLTETDRILLPILLSWIRSRSPASVLDLGCGNGALTNELAKHCQRCVGMDISRSGITLAKNRYPSHDFLLADLQQPLPKMQCQQFDCVVSIEVVEHLLLPRQLFARARESLRPGGELILSTPYHGYWKNLALAVTGRFDSHWHPLRDYGHVKFFSVSTMTQLFEEQGFEVTDIRFVGRFPALARSMLYRGRLRGDSLPISPAPA